MKRKLFSFFFLSLSLCLTAQAQINLNQACVLALKNNFNIQIAENEAQQAKNNNHIGNAGMLPNVSVAVSDNPSLSNINQKFTNGSSIERNGVSSNAFNASLLLSYTLFDGKKMFAIKERLSLMDQAAQEQLRIQVQSMIAQVVFNYSNIYRQQAYLQVLNVLKGLSQQRLDLVKARQLAGLANHTDLYLAQLEMESNAQQINTQKANIQKAYFELNALMNLKIDSVYTVEKITNFKNDLDKTKLDSLLVQNPENVWALQQVKIAMQAQKEIESARLPLLKLTGAYNFARSQSQAGFSLYNQSIGPQAGISLVMPLFNGNVTKSNIENAKLNVDNARLKLEQTKMNVRLAYEQAWQDYLTAKMQLNSDSLAVETAEKYIQLMQERLKLNQSTLLEFKEAERTYEEANYRKISNQYIAEIAATQILLLCGQGSF